MGWIKKLILIWAPRTARRHTHNDIWVWMNAWMNERVNEWIPLKIHFDRCASADGVEKKNNEIIINDLVKHIDEQNVDSLFQCVNLSAYMHALMKALLWSGCGDIFVLHVGKPNKCKKTLWCVVTFLILPLPNQIESKSQEPDHQDQLRCSVAYLEGLFWKTIAEHLSKNRELMVVKSRFFLIT